MVLHVLVGGDAAVVQDIEESRGGDGQLDGWGQAAVLGQHVLVVPAPVSSGHGSSVSDGVVELSAEQPGGELVNLDLTKRDVGLAVEHSGVIGAVDSLAVSGGELSEHLGASLKF